MTEQAVKPPGWAPPFSLEERLKHLFVPPSLYMAYKAAKERRLGEAEFALIPFLCAKAKSSIDVGANVGVWSWAMAKHSTRVHAFEPNPKNLAKLRRNLGTVANISIHGVALGDRAGEATLRIPRGAKGHSNQGASLSRAAVGDDRAYTALAVEQKPLDDCAIDNVGFIKIDVEGFEQSVLQGAGETIARDRPNLLMEIEEAHTDIPVDDSVRRVEALGYRCLYLRRGTLTPFSQFDPAADHGNPQAPEDYVFNFIFLPEPA
jgi:FkbM family methyltransferase